MYNEIMKIKRYLPLIIEVATFLLILAIIYPLLSPIIDPAKTFLFGDLTTAMGPDSGNLTFERSLYIFEPFRSQASFEYMRYSPLFGALAGIASLVNFTESWVWAVMILISLLLGLWGLRQLVHQFISKDSIIRALLFLVVALFYVFNFYSITRVLHVFIWFTYLVFPMAIYLGILLSKKFKISTLVAYTLLLIVFGTIPHSFIYMAFIHLGLTSYLLLQKQFRRSFIFFILPLAFFALSHAFFAEGSLLANVGYPRKINISELEFLSGDASVFNSLSFRNIWWIFIDRGYLFDNTSYAITGLIVSSMVIVMWVILLVRMLWKKLFRNAIFLVLVGVGFAAIVLMASGMNFSGVSGLVDWLADQNKLDVLALFREWSRILLFLPMIYVGIFLWFSRILDTNLRNVVVIGAGGVMFMHLMFSPILVPYLRDFYAPVAMPEEYATLMEEVPQDEKALWIYPGNTQDVEGFKRFSWNTNKTVNSSGNRLENSVGSHYGEEFEGYPLLFKYLEENEVEEDLLSQVNILNVVRRRDILTSGDPVFSDLYGDVSYSTDEHFDRFFIDDPQNLAYTIKDPRIVVDPSRDLDLYAKLYRALDGAFVLADRPVEGATNAVVVRENMSLDELILDRVVLENPEFVTFPSENSTYHEPKLYWSKGSTYNAEHQDFTTYLSENGISNYQEDYGRGILFTYAPPSVPEDVQENAPLRHYYDFTVPITADGFIEETPIEQQGARQDISMDGEYLVFSLKDKTDGWKYISTPKIPVVTGEMLRFRYEFKLRYVHEPHFKIVVLDSEGQMLREDYITDLKDIPGDTDVEKNIDYYVFHPEAAFIQCQLWHGHDTQMPLPNEVLLKKVWVYDVTAEAQFPTHVVPRTATGNYETYVRILESPSSWGVRMTIGTKDIVLDTNSEKERFVWRRLGTFSGEEKIRIENNGGFNAVSAIVRIPDHRKDILWDEQWGLLQESVSESVIFLEGCSESECDAYIPFDGTYLIRGVDDTRFTVQIDGVPYHGQEAALTEGKHSILVWGEPEAVVLVSSGLEDNQYSYNSIEAVRVNPLKIEGSITVASAPTLVVLNEIYNENWVLEGAGSSNDTVEPIPVMYAVNGYIIDEPGTYDVSFVFGSGVLITWLKIASYVVFAVLAALGVVAWKFKR